jgi:hypothetical protein
MEERVLLAILAIVDGGDFPNWRQNPEIVLQVRRELCDFVPRLLQLDYDIRAVWLMRVNPVNLSIMTADRVSPRISLKYEV